MVARMYRRRTFDVLWSTQYGKYHGYHTIVYRCPESPHINWRPESAAGPFFSSPAHNPIGEYLQGTRITWAASVDRFASPQLPRRFPRTLLLASPLPCRPRRYIESDLPTPEVRSHNHNRRKMSKAPESPAAPIGPQYKEEEEKPQATYGNPICPHGGG